MFSFILFTHVVVLGSALSCDLSRLQSVHKLIYVMDLFGIAAKQYQKRLPDDDFPRHTDAAEVGP